MLTIISTQMQRVFVRSTLIILVIAALILAFIYHWVNNLYLIAGIIAGVAVLSIVNYLGYRKVNHSKEYIKTFTPVEGSDTFDETLPKLFNGSRVKHLVLLIHGFSASTNEFRYLVKELEKAGIPYYAPPITGFGLTNLRKLKTIQKEDWLRDAIYTAKIAAGMADSVSIIAHSMGVNLALYLSQILPPQKAVFIAPYVAVKRNHGFAKKLLQTPLLSPVFCMLNPMVRKNNQHDMEQLRNSGRFVYTAVPTESVRALWNLIDYCSPLTLPNIPVRLYFGKNDTTINATDVLERFHYLDNCTVHRFERSGHNLLEDAEHTEVIDSIVTFLKNPD